MDSAYQDDATRSFAQDGGLAPVVPPNLQRRLPRTYDRQLYRQHNRIECLFRRFKAWRRVCTHYDKIDILFVAFITVALIAQALR